MIEKGGEREGTCWGELNPRGTENTSLSRGISVAFSTFLTKALVLPPSQNDAFRSTEALKAVAINTNAPQPGTGTGPPIFFDGEEEMGEKEKVGRKASERGRIDEIEE